MKHYPSCMPVFVCFFLACSMLDAGIVAGRVLNEARDVRFKITAGAIMDLEGDVRETTRTYYEATGRYEDQEDRESYSLDDFGMDGGYPTIGFNYENAARFFAFQFDASFAMPDVSTVALRNYYIGVDGVSYDGVDYDYMMIPEGTPFTVDLLTCVMEIRGLFTPFTLKTADDTVMLTPFVNFGLFVLASQYDIDAGPAEGVVQYLDPPEDFVRGGEASGLLAGGFPELGLGAELRLGSPAGKNLLFKCTYAGFQFSGDTGLFTSADHRNKDIELDHVNIKLGCELEIPVNEGRCLTFGVDYRMIDSKASVTSKEFPDEVVIDRHERFDKDADFSLTSFTAHAGMTF